MKKRHIFSTPDLDTAKAALAAARSAGIGPDDTSLIARSDIELEQPEQHDEAASDFYPAAARGAITGGTTGLLAGLVAIAIPPIGVTLAGVAALGASGAMVGSWIGAMVGAEVPDPVRRQFEDEIQAGRILLAVDGDAEQLARAEPRLIDAGATPLPFDKPRALT